MKDDRYVELLKMLADQTRWRMLNLLPAAPENVNDLTGKLGISQYNVSKHLRILRGGGLVVSERRGKEVISTVAPDFRAKVREGGWALDLGCCTFRFDRPPKA